MKKKQTAAQLYERFIAKRREYLAAESALRQLGKEDERLRKAWLKRKTEEPAEAKGL